MYKVGDKIKIIAFPDPCVNGLIAIVEAIVEEIGLKPYACRVKIIKGTKKLSYKFHFYFGTC